MLIFSISLSCTPRFSPPPPGGIPGELSESCLPWQAQLKAFAKAYRSKQDIEPVPAFFGDMGKDFVKFFLSRLIFSRESIDYFFFQRKLILRVFWYLNGETRCLGFQDREVFLRFHCCKFPLCDLKVEEIDLGNI